MSTGMQINLFCLTCFHWEGCYFHVCMLNKHPNACTHYVRQYICPGGLNRDRQITRAECQECARTCSGCFHMAIAYGYIDKSEVEHLLDCRPFPWPGYSKDWVVG
jgi:hypothetical protein